MAEVKLRHKYGCLSHEFNKLSASPVFEGNNCSMSNNSFKN